jgi:hypothetical protein
MGLDQVTVNLHLCRKILLILQVRHAVGCSRIRFPLAVLAPLINCTATQCLFFRLYPGERSLSGDVRLRISWRSPQKEKYKEGS